MSRIKPARHVAGHVEGILVHAVKASERALARKETEQREEEFRTLMDSIPQLVWMAKADGYRFWYNRRWYEYTGTTPEQMEGWGWQSVHDPKMLPKVMEQWSASVRTGDPFEMVFPLRGADGAFHEFLTRVVSTRDERGSIVRWVGTNTDITPQRKAEEAARESEGRLRALLDALPAAIYTTDAEGHLTHFNPAAVEFSGRVPQLGTDRWCVTWKLFRADGTPLPHDECPMTIALREGRIVEGVECFAERPDGTRIWFTPHPRLLRNADGKIVGGVNMLVDITERKQAERANSLLAAIVASSDDAIISKNLDGTITSWNDSAERLFGYTPEEAVGRHITLIVPPDRRDEEAQILARLRRGERVEHFQTVRMRGDGTRLDLSLTISPVRDSAGRVIGASKVARDITEQRRSEHALRESEERFRRLSATLDAEVRARTRELEARNADVLRQAEQLHDLSRRLLNAQDEQRRHIARELHDSAGQTLAALAMSLAELVEKVVRDSPELAADAEAIQELVQRVHQEIRTTSYLLHPPLLDEIGLSSALSWYTEGLRERSGLDISLNFSADVGRLPRDTELVVFRVVQECVTNIHRHSGSKTASIRIARDAEMISVEVQDQGKGMSAEKLTEIQSRGSGVGIRGMRERVRQLDGDMNIESNSSGTRISVRIPAPKTAVTED